ncbi:MAG: hypothetical protein V4498_05330 [candidate division FCPU426 bacterium]
MSLKARMPHAARERAAEAAKKNDGQKGAWDEGNNAAATADAIPAATLITRAHRRDQVKPRQAAH